MQTKLERGTDESRGRHPVAIVLTEGIDAMDGFTMSYMTKDAFSGFPSADQVSERGKRHLINRCSV